MMDPLFGWQKTKAGPSIEQTLEETLERILQEPITLQAASRTDRGVHARGQCLNFLTTKTIDLERLISSLNALLPFSIRVIDGRKMPLDFHPTLQVERKEYHYEISLGKIQLPQERFFSWHLPYPLDLEQMKKASTLFLGRHDFASFCNKRRQLNYTDTMRHIDMIEIETIHTGNLRLMIRGNHFLYKMVRNIVGTLVYVGRGKLSLETLTLLFSHPSRIEAGMTAPAHGLTLHAIDYPPRFGLNYEPIPLLAKGAF